MIKRLAATLTLAVVMLLGVLVSVASADNPIIVDLDQGEEDYRVTGEDSLHYLGEMACGDINADGIPDLIIGASGYDVMGTPPITDAGAVYVIFGSPDLSGTLDLNGSGATADIVIHGYVPSGYDGHTVASGDVNGDGYADIIIGADVISHTGRNEVGAVYIVHGPITREITTAISLSDTAWVGLTVYGDNAWDRFGRAVAAGDVNGDDVDDLIVGAYGADGAHGSDSGKAYVFYGGASLTGTLDLDTDTADVTIIGQDGYDYLGRSIVTGDVNGDGTADLIASAYQADPEGRTRAGEIILLYGSDSISPTIDLSEDNLTGSGLGLVLYGVNSNEGAGFYVGAGNINGDKNPGNGVGYADILVGVYLETHNETGKGYAIYGGPTITSGVTITPGTFGVNISECVDITLYPADTGDRLGRSVASGDLNGDGYDDFIIGASRGDPAVGRTNAGETYVFYGGTNLSPTITISPTADTDITVLGDDANDESGRSAAVGDINGDGVMDMIVGAVMASNGQGEVYAVWGPKATSIAIEPSSDVITAGQQVTFTVTAQNDYSQTWNVTTYTTTFAIASAAGGEWRRNVYTTEFSGGWLVTATHKGLTATTTITVNHAAPTSMDLTPLAATLSAGQSVTYTLAAYDVYGNVWDASADGAYTITLEAGGAWTANRYTTEKDGIWTVTGTLNGLIDTGVLTVTNVAPTAIISGSTTGDEGEAMVFDASLSHDPGNDIVSYAWDFDYGGSFSADATGITTSHIYLDDGIYILALRVSDDNGATDFQTTTLTIANVAPSVEAGSNQTVSEGSLASFAGSFTDQGALDTHSIQWMFGDQTSAAGTLTPTHTFAEPGVFIVTLTITDDDGGVGADTLSVTVNNLAPVAEAGGPYLGDEGASIVLSGSASTDPGGGTLQYAWDLDEDGAFDDAYTVVTSYTWGEPGTHTVGLLVTDTQGLAGTDTAQVTVGNLAPVAEAGGPYSGDEGASIALSGSASTDPGGGTLQYAWDLDEDGAFDDAYTAVTSYTWGEPGTYTVGLLVTDTQGLAGTDTAQVTVGNLAPVAEAGGPYSGDEGASIALSASGSDPGGGEVLYAWDLDNDGAFDDAYTAVISYTWSEPGMYTIGLRVADSQGLTDTDTAQVTVANLAPTAEAGGPYTGYEWLPIALGGSASSDPGGGTLEYAWDLDNDGLFDDGFTAATSYTWYATGTYTVGLWVTDTQGLTSTDTAQVTVVNAPPTAEAGGPYSGNEAASIVLSGSASFDPGGGMISYAWDLDEDGTFDDAYTAVTSYTWGEPGTYTVGLLVTDTQGLTGTDTAQVTVGNLVPTAEASGPYSGDEGASIALSGSASTDPGGGTLQYAWDLDEDGAFDDAYTAVTSYTWGEPGTYTVGLLVTDTQGLAGTDTAQVTVGNLAPVAEAGGPYSGDEGASIALNGSDSSDPGGGVLLYAWDLDNDGTFDDAYTVVTSYTWHAPGTYTVSLRVTDTLGLGSIDTARVTVGNVAPTAEAGGPYSGDEGSAIAFDGGGSSDPGGAIVLYEWDFQGDGIFDATGMTVSHPYLNDGIYTVALRVTDAHSATDVDTATVTVSNVLPTVLAIANTSPTNEGASITFTVTATDPGTDALAYGFDWNNDGDFSDPGEVVTQVSPVAATSWTDNGNYTVHVRVYDDDAYTDATHQVAVLNVPPIADAGGPYSGVAGVSIALDASASSDPGVSDTLNYTWDLDGDGAFDDAAGVTVTHIWSQASVYTITLRVVDDDGGQDTASARVTVAAANVARIVVSPAEATLAAGQTQTYLVEAFDVHDNSLGDVTAQTLFTITTAARGSWAGNHYTAEKAGTWVVTATYGILQDSAALTVTCASIHHIVLAPASAEIVAGQSITYAVEALDAYDNVAGDVTAASTFTISAGAGGAWNGNVYLSEIEGDWTVTAAYQTWEAHAALRVSSSSFKLFLPLITRQY